MEQDNKKYITLGFLFAGALAALVANVLFEALAANIGFFGKYWQMTFVQHGLPIAVGSITFFVLQFMPKTVVWADEVIGELRKVTWPTRKDTSAMTTVTCVMLIIAGVGLFFFDFVSTKLVAALLQFKL